jgi:type I restriction enzyme S subunit
MAERAGTVDPLRHPDEVFVLYSIPAFDNGVSDVLAGREIGSSKQVVQPGDVLLSKIVPHIRRAWVVGPQDGNRIIASSEWIVFRSVRFVPEYLRHVLMGDPFHAQFMKTVSGVGGSLLRARPAHVGAIKIPLPSLPVQQRIADILDTADALRRKRSEAIRLANDLVPSLFYEMFGDGKRYDTKPLGELIDPSRPITYGILMPGENVEDGVPYVRVVDMKGDQIAVSQLRRTSTEIDEAYKRSRILPGDVLVSIRGHVGRTVVVPDTLAIGNITQDTARLALADRLLTHFLTSYLRSSYASHWMQRRTKGVAVRGINLGELRNLPVPVVGEKLIARFNSAVSEWHPLEAHQASSKVELDNLFHSLLQRAFGGSCEGLDTSGTKSPL